MKKIILATILLLFLFSSLAYSEEITNDTAFKGTSVEDLIGINSEPRTNRPERKPRSLKKRINGYVFFGKYLSHQNYFCQADQQSETAFRSGFFIELPLVREKEFSFSFYHKTTVLMDQQVSSGAFHPAGVEFDAGISVLFFETGEMRLEHTCWHPVDSAGEVGEYNLLEFRLHF